MALPSILPFTGIDEITHAIQLAIAPVFLLTAVGTLLMVFTNRLSRAVDRRRVVKKLLPELGDGALSEANDELAHIARRIQLIYTAIVLAVLCALFICLLIAVAFIDAFIDANLGKVLGVLFVLAMLALIAALITFLREIFIAVTPPGGVIR
jgi:hypothetical protein